VKSIFASKVFYANALSLIYALVQTHMAIPAVDPTTLAIATAVVNVVLRFVTKVPVTFAIAG
jgi:hypothetical protein